MPQIPAPGCADLGIRGAELADGGVKKPKPWSRLVKKRGVKKNRCGYRERKPHPTSMASLSDRLPQNAPGRFYVDASCIDCDQCRAVAPQFFGRDAETGFSFVQHQPATAGEIAEVEQILTDCSVASIGNDGA
jgi:ferredoxin